jgi:hypothetical protein
MVAFVCAAASSCSINTSPVVCDLVPRPSNPAGDLDSISFGFAVVTATIGERDGSTKVYDPGYRADIYTVEVDAVLVDRTGAGADRIDSVASVDYPKPAPGCGDPIGVARLEPGQRVMLIVFPPGPSRDVWTVDGDLRVLDLPDEAGGRTAFWQTRTAGCDGHLGYDVTSLTAAFTDPTARVSLHGNCSS